MTDTKQPQGAVEAAEEIAICIASTGKLRPRESLNPCQILALAAIIAEKVRPMVEALGSLYDSLMEDGKPPFVGEGDERVYQLIGGKMSNSLDTIRAALIAWKGEG